jgi:hypothetical protein
MTAPINDGFERFQEVVIPTALVETRPSGHAGPLARIDRPAGSITELLFMAVEKGTPVAELKELVALHEHMSKRQAHQEFSQAMATFQAECRAIKRSSTAKVTTKTGGTYEFTYAELDEIARTINPILAKYGLSYSWDSKVERESLTCICTVRHINGHSETSSLTLPIENPSAMNPQQKVGAALTFAQRRTLSAALGLTTTDASPDTKDADPTPITDDQATHVEDLLAELTKGKPPEKGASIRARFLKHMSAPSIAAIRATDYERAVSALRRTT